MNERKFFLTPMEAIKINPFRPDSSPKILDLSDQLPGDKSLTHRALIVASMACGETLITGYSESADCKSTCEVLRRLGVKIAPTETGSGSHCIPALLVQSPGVESWKSPLQELDFGNSGTTARLMMGVLSSCPQLEVICHGDASLSRRPMNRIVDPLRKCGAQIEYLKEDGKLPVRIVGKKLKATHHAIKQASAQIKSALCLAALQTKGVMSMDLPAGSRDHTEKLLKRLGAKLTITNLMNPSSENIAQEKISIEGPFELPNLESVHVPKDPSAMIFLMALGVLHPTFGKTLIFKNVLDNAGRLAFVALFESIGLKIKRISSSTIHHAIEAMTHFEIKMDDQGPKKQMGFNINRENVSRFIDEIPMLALLSAFLPGVSRFYGLEELRVKECDRLEQSCRLLELIGACFELKGNDLTVMGSAEHTFDKFEYDPQSDHRMAMVASVIATRGQNPSLVMEPQCVGVSFPLFFSGLSRCGIKTEMYNHPHFQIDDISFRDIGKICNGEKSSSHYCS